MDIGGRMFSLSKEIGRGAFGVVWQAREQNLAPGAAEPPMVVKDVSASDSKALAAANFEAQLLQLLSKRLSACAWDHVPRYVCHSAVGNRAGGGSVRTVMSFLRGRPLDQWLYSMSDEEHKRVDAKLLVFGGLPGSRQRSMPLAAAASFAQDMVSQLVPVLADLQPYAFHRDISSHNILIEVCEALDGKEGAHFGLIDFGLAVRASSWQRDWTSANLAGDPRYWTPAAWMAFAFGFKYVQAHPNRGFQRQYLARIDHFSLGVLGLEVLFSLWSSSAAECRAAPGMQQAHEAWCTFWHASIRFFQTFHVQGMHVCREFVARSQEGVTRFVSHLKRLRQALRQAAAFSENAHFAGLLMVFADFLDERGRIDWVYVPAALEEPGRVSYEVPQGMSTDGGGGNTWRSPRRPGPAIQSSPLVKRYDSLSGSTRNIGLPNRSASFVAASPAGSPVRTKLDADQQYGVQRARQLLASCSMMQVPSPAAQYLAPVLSAMPFVVPAAGSYVPPPKQLSASYVPMPSAVSPQGLSTSWVPLAAYAGRGT